MLEIWEAVGHVLTDETYHKSLFDALTRDHTARGREFEHLLEFRALLRHDLNVGRWEVMTIHRILTERDTGGATPTAIVSLANDVEIPPLQQKWRLGGRTSTTIPADAGLCQVLGVAGMDAGYRKLLLTAALVSEAELALFLVGAPGQPTEQEGPKFNVVASRVRELREFLLDGAAPSAESLLTSFHQARWVQPIRYACDGGYTDTVGVYVYLDQPSQIALLLTLNPLLALGILDVRPEMRPLLELVQGRLQGIVIRTQGASELPLEG